MKIGEALEVCKKGGCAFRKGWNGKDQWICYVGPAQSIAYEGHEVFKFLHELQGGSEVVYERRAYFVMFGPNWWQPGWVASQADLAADDWQVMIGRWGEKLT